MLFGWHVRYVFSSLVAGRQSQSPPEQRVFSSVKLSKRLVFTLFFFSPLFFGALCSRKKKGLDNVRLCYFTVQMFWFVSSISCLAWPANGQWFWQSHIVLFVLVLLVLDGGLGRVDRLLLDHSAVGLRRVADVVATLVYVVRSFVPVAVLVHGVEQDENAERRCCHDADHHPRRAGWLPEDFRGAGVCLRSCPSRIGWRGERNVVSVDGKFQLFFLSNFGFKCWWQWTLRGLCGFVRCVSQISSVVSGLVVQCLPWDWWVVGFNPDRVTPKTVKMLPTGSLLGTVPLRGWWVKYGDKFSVLWDVTNKGTLVS